MPSSSHGTGDYCSARNCHNARRKEQCIGLSFFQLPHRQEERCRIWIQNMRRGDLLSKTMEEIKRAGYRLCSIHFEDSQFNVPSERKRLVWNAVPTLFDVPNPPATITLKRELKIHPFLSKSPAKLCKKDVPSLSSDEHPQEATLDNQGAQGSSTMETEQRSLVNGDSESSDQATKTSHSKPEISDGDVNSNCDSDETSGPELKGSSLIKSRDIIKNGIKNDGETNDLDNGISNENDTAKKSEANMNGNATDEDDIKSGEGRSPSESDVDDHDDEKNSCNDGKMGEEEKDDKVKVNDTDETEMKSIDGEEEERSNKDVENESVDQESKSDSNDASAEPNEKVSGKASDDEGNDKQEGKSASEEVVIKVDEKDDSEKENANSDCNTDSKKAESGTNTASSITTLEKQVDSSNDDIEIIGESKVFQISSPSIPNSSSQNVIIIPPTNSTSSNFPSKSAFGGSIQSVSSRAYSPSMASMHPGFLMGGNSPLTQTLSMLPQPVAPPQPKSSLDQIELIRWEILNRINTRPKYFKPNPTAELGPLSKFLFDIGSDLIKESVYHELVKIQSKKCEDDKLSEKEKEDLEKLKEIEKDLNNTVGHLKFRMRKRCRACHFQTESSSVMYHHKQFPHEDNKNLLCAHCNFVTKQPMSFKFHIESEHNIQPRLHDKKFFYECNLCPYENNQELKLNIHKQRCTKQFRPLFNLHPSCLSGAEINLCLENIFYKPLIPKNLKILQQKHLQQQAALAEAKKQQAEVAALAAQKNAQAALAKRQRQPPPSQQRFNPPMNVRPHFQPRLPQPSMSQVRFNSRPPVQPMRPTVANMLKDKHSPKVGSGVSAHQNSGAPVGFEVCEICGGYVKDRKALRIHFFYAHRIDLPLNLFDRNQPPLYCATCCVRFWTANGLRKHLEVHAQEKRIPEGFVGEGVSGKCIACGQLVGNIVVHMRVVHNREIHHYINALMCMFCGASFNSHANVERHIKDVHGTIDIATGAVKMKGKLKASPAMPKIIHPSKKSAPNSGGNNSLVKGSVCVLCNLNFGRNVDLTRHCMRMHHTCMKCGMVVIDKASLLKHTCLSSPSGTRDCVMCSETGFHPAYYVKHLRDKHLRKFTISVARLSVAVIERWTKRSYPFKEVKEELVEISDSDEDEGAVAKFSENVIAKPPLKKPRIGPASKINRPMFNGIINTECDNHSENNNEGLSDKTSTEQNSSSPESPMGSKRKHSFDAVSPERSSKRRK